MIRLREVREADVLAFIYPLVNRPHVLEMASRLNRAPVSEEAHIDFWYQALVLHEPKGFKARIIELEGRPIGVVEQRPQADHASDRVKKPRLYLNIYLEKEFMNRGHGTEALRRFMEEMPERCIVTAIIRPENLASIRVFEKVGFVLKEQRSEAEFLIYERHFPEEQPS